MQLPRISKMFFIILTSFRQFLMFFKASSSSVRNLKSYCYVGTHLVDCLQPNQDYLPQITKIPLIQSILDETTVPSSCVEWSRSQIATTNDISAQHHRWSVPDKLPNSTYHQKWHPFGGGQDQGDESAFGSRPHTPCALADIAFHWAPKAVNTHKSIACSACGKFPVTGSRCRSTGAHNFCRNPTNDGDGTEKAHPPTPSWLFVAGNMFFMPIGICRGSSWGGLEAEIPGIRCLNHLK